MNFYNNDLTDGYINWDVQGKKFYSEFNINLAQCTDLISLKGCPQIIKGDLRLMGCSSLTSLEYAPKEVHNNISIEGTSITSLKGIGVDYLCRIDGKFYINDKITSNILGLLKIKNLQHINYVFIGNLEKSSALMGTIEIINKHLKTNRDIVKCKQELIEAGLKEFGKL